MFEVVRDTSLLHPHLRRHAEALGYDLIKAYEAGLIKYQFRIYETYRSPQRQDHLLTKGTTKARAWQSAHQYGLAIDFVPFLFAHEAKELGVRQGWHWPKAEHFVWDQLDEAALQHGLLRPIEWDRPHIVSPLWNMIEHQLT